MILWLVATGHAALFDDVTSTTLGTTAEWSNKVRLADLDADGDLDVLFANGGNYDTAGVPETNRIFRNDGDGVFTPIPLPGGPDLTRSLAVGDVNDDGFPDVLVAGAYQTVSRLFLGSASGGFTLADTLPTTVHSIGDVELGDVDDDGDLDAVLVDWGAGDPLSNDGAPALLWRNDGTGRFTADAAAMPTRPIGMSWDLTLADVDGDFDLDFLAASKTNQRSKLFLNDGSGTFANASWHLPPAENNYAMEPMDVDGDGDLDLFTVNDGPDLGERLLINDGTSVFTESPTQFPAEADAGEDDNVIVFLDVDDDGDPDAIIGSLSGDDRLLERGPDAYSLSETVVFNGSFTSGTLGVAFGDLNGDGRLDAVMAQGEVADDERMYFGAEIAPDTRPPVLTLQRGQPGIGAVYHVRAHDRMTPVRASDLSVELRTASGVHPFAHMGGDVFRLVWPGNTTSMEVCAMDRAGNEGCVPLVFTPVPETPTPASIPPTTPTEPTASADDYHQLCHCGSTGPVGSWTVLVALGFVYQRRRRASAHRKHHGRFQGS